MTSLRHEYDIVVVGAGPAGLAAACETAGSGLRVAVLDNAPWLGGQIWRGEQAQPTLRAARYWMERFKTCGATLISSATVFASPSPHVLRAETPGGAVDVAWKKLILATGAREMFVPFPGWTLPGVVGPGGIHALSKAGWPVAGKRYIIAGSGPLLLAAADGLKQHGARVQLIAEQAPWGRFMRFGINLWHHPGKLIQGMGVSVRLLGVPFRCGCWPVRAEGSDSLQRVTLTDGKHTWTQECDGFACGFNLVPNVELPLLLGCKLDRGTVIVNELQETTVADIYCAGEPTGVGGVECALVEGRIAGLIAVGKQDQARELFSRRVSWHHFRNALEESFELRSELRRLASPDTVVCRCEDVRRRQLEPLANWREAKLHTRCGMGSCQGRTCGSATQFLFGWNNESMRPPVFPVSVGALTMKSEGDS